MIHLSLPDASTKTSLGLLWLCFYAATDIALNDQCQPQYSFADELSVNILPADNRV